MNMLTADEMAASVSTFMRASPSPRSWDVDEAFDWAAADANKLTDGQRSAVEFITVIEDHLPGYFDLYRVHFPVDASVDETTFLHNRELYHFSVRWAQEEDKHAIALSRYQLESGMADAAALRTSLAQEGRKDFSLPYCEPVQFFTYALIQEKATQLYYQQLRAAVDEEVLGQVLARLSRDEARHFAFFADVMERHIASFGPAILPPVQEVLQSFKMPLAETMENYWRWALYVADVAGGYDHTQAYEALVSVVRRAADQSQWRGQAVDFETLVRTIRRLP